MGFYPEIETVAAPAVGMLVFMMVMYLFAFGLSIATYILHALGLYTIAQRRGLKYPWMAWIPVVNMWVLGSIADQYHYVVWGQIRNRRKWLLGLNIAMVVLSLAIFCVYIGMFVNLILQIPQMHIMGPEDVISVLGTPLLWMLIIGLVIWIAGLATVVFQYICYYDLFASCSPENKVLFLVLSILFNVTLPFFVFACRKKDGGMPPRKAEAVPVLEAEVYTEE